MSYIPVTLNHMRAVKAWADRFDARVDLDLRTFNLEVKFRNRYYIFKPRFLVQASGQMSYSTQLSNEVTGFIGWLPYDILQWDISQDKLLFKRFLGDAGLKFPVTWPSMEEVDTPFLVKQSAGSFGYRIGGPYRDAWEVPPSDDTAGKGKNGGINFAEQFVAGTNLKVWFWGAKAFYAHVHPYPTVVGDGVSSARILMEARLAKVGKKFDAETDSANILSSLQYQQIRLGDIPSEGQALWIDFRYGRQYVSTAPTATSDNDIDQLDPRIMQQIDAMGAKAAAESLRRFKAPVLYSVDGVLDAAGTVWWLEINSNPILPPDGYPLIFLSLFGAVGKPA